MIAKLIDLAGRHPVTAMVVATFLWGATFVVIRDTVSTLDPGSLVLIRFAIASIAFAFLQRGRWGPWDRATLLSGVVAGLFTLGCYWFQAIGLTQTQAGTSAFLTAGGTLFAGLFAWPLLGQRPGAPLAVGLGLAALGTSFMGPKPDLGLGSGEWWTLFGALSYALQIVVVARLGVRVDPIAMAGMQALVVTLALLPLAGEASRQLASLDAAAWWRIGYLAIAGSVIAPILQMAAQRSLPAGRIGLLFALEPVFALLFAVSVGGERFGFRWWCGAALILFAVWSVERRGRREPSLAPSA